MLPTSVEELAARYPYEAGHMRQVARLAVLLFDALQAVHGYGADERLLLLCAGRLHDIGVNVDAEHHHKATLRMILEADLPPFTPREQRMIALIARYHRKAVPSAKHDAFTELDAADQQRVRWLAALLRVADGLDRTHTDAVKDVRCIVTDDKLRVIALISGPAEEEREFGQAKADLLEEVVGRRVVVEMKNEK